MNHRDTESTETDQERGGRGDPLTERIIGLAVEVHRALGPGLLESAYEACLGHELALADLPFLRQVPLPVSAAFASAGS